MQTTNNKQQTTKSHIADDNCGAADGSKETRYSPLNQFFSYMTTYLITAWIKDFI